MWAKLKTLTRLGRITLVLFLAVVANGILEYSTGYQLFGGDLLGVLFAISLCILLISWARRLTRKLLWRLRNRLFVSYALFGVVPLVLILVMLTISAFVLFGQIAGSMVADDLGRHTDRVFSAAYDLALDTLFTMRSGAKPQPSSEFVEGLRQRVPRLRAIVVSGKDVFSIPENAEFPEIPQWNTPGFKGVVEKNHFFSIAGHARAENAGKAVDVLAFTPIDAEMAADLAKDIGYVGFFTGRVESSNRNIVVNDSAAPASVVAPETGRMPAALGFWDLPIGWISFLPSKSFDGKSGTLLMTIQSRPSRIVPRLFSSLNMIASFLG